MSKNAIGVGTLLSLAGEVCAKLFGHILWEDVCWVDGQVTEVKHTQILLLFGSSVNLYFTMGLLLPLTAGRVSSFVPGVVGLHLPPLCCLGVKVA